MTPKNDKQFLKGYYSVPREEKIKIDKNLLLHTVRNNVYGLYMLRMCCSYTYMRNFILCPK